MRVRGRLSLLLLVAGCSGNSQSGALGTIAYAAADTGDLTSMDVATGESQTLSNGGPYGSISISSDGGEIAFAQDEPPPNLDARVYAIETESGELRNISQLAAAAPTLSWLRSGWLSYSVRWKDVSRTALVGPGLATRLIGTLNYSPVAESPIGTSIAYMDCIERGSTGCSSEVVVEQPDGTDRVVLAEGVTGAEVRFTPDGSAVVYMTDVGAENHLLVQPISGGAATDLGPVQGITRFQYGGLIPGGSPFSPAGDAILANRNGQLVAIALDGSGDRLIVNQAPYSAAFTANGDVVYELMTFDDPSSDTSPYQYSSFVVSPSGDVTKLRQNDPSCTLSIISPSGAYVGYSCFAVPIYRIDGSHVIDATGTELLGFDRDEQGVVVGSTAAISYVVLATGDRRELTKIFYSTRYVAGPLYDYYPGS